jgi:hypothetical protein
MLVRLLFVHLHGCVVAKCATREIGKSLKI